MFFFALRWPFFYASAYCKLDCLTSATQRHIPYDTPLIELSGEMDNVTNLQAYGERDAMRLRGLSSVPAQNGEPIPGCKGSRENGTIVMTLVQTASRRQVPVQFPASIESANFRAQVVMKAALRTTYVTLWMEQI